MTPEGPKIVPPIVPLAAVTDVIARRVFPAISPKLADIDPVQVMAPQFTLPCNTFKEPPVAILPTDDIVPALIVEAYKLPVVEITPALSDETKIVEKDEIVPELGGGYTIPFIVETLVIDDIEAMGVLNA